MEADIKFHKPLVAKANPLTCFFCKYFSSLYSTEAYLVSLFNRSKFLRTKYGSLQDLWTQVIAFSSSQDEQSLAVLTSDYIIAKFDLRHEYILTARMPLIEGIMLCNIVISGNKVIIGGVYQILIIDMKTKLLTGIDYTSPSSITKLTTTIDIYLQRRLKNPWHDLVKKYRIAHNGTFREVGNKGKGVVGLLCSRTHFCELYKISDKKSYKNKSNYNPMHCVLQLTTVSYYENEKTYANQKVLDIEYSLDFLPSGTDGSCLLLKADFSCEIAIIALNSTNSLYSQVYLLNTTSLFARKLHLVRFIRENNMLTMQGLGHVPMIISGIEWHPNSLFAIILFFPNYFCIISKSGEPLYSLYCNSIRYFSILPIENEEFYHTLTINSKTLYIFTNIRSTIIDFDYKHKAKLVEALELNKGVENEVNTNLVVKDMLKSIEIIRWSGEVGVDAVEFIRWKLYNLSKVLYENNEPLYLIHLIKVFRRYMKHSMVNVLRTVRFFGNTKSIRENLIDSLKSAVNFEGIKGLLMFYWIMQFRNLKAASFNILYIMTAGIFKNRWINKVDHKQILKCIMSILNSNSILEKKEKVDFFDTELRTHIEDKGDLYRSLSEFADNNFAPITDMKQETSLKDSILKFYEPEELSTIFKILNEVERRSSMEEMLLSEFSDSKDNYMKCIYKFAYEINKGEFDPLFSLSCYLFNSLNSPDIPLETEIQLILLILYSSLLLLALSLLDTNHVLNLFETHTFLWKIILRANPIQTFNQLKAQRAKPIQSLEWTKGNKIMSIAISLLLKVSEYKLAITKAIEATDPHIILIGLLIFDKRLNKNISKKKIDKELLKSVASSIAKLLDKYPLFVIKDVLQVSNLLSNAMAMSSKASASVILSLVLPWLVNNLRGLLYAPHIQAEENFSAKENLKNEFTPWHCIDELRKTLCESSTEVSLKVARKHFGSKKQMVMFDIIFQEVMQILAISIHKSLILVSDTCREDIFIVADCFPSKVANHLKEALSSFLSLVWELTLLLLIEENKDSLRLAGNLIRITSLSLNEQSEIGFIHQALIILKNTDYSKIKGGISAIEELANALTLYTKKWGAILKAEKNDILIQIKQQNPSLYEAIEKYKAKRSPYATSKGYNLAADVVFQRMVNCVKGILTKLPTVTSSLLTQANEGHPLDALESQFKKALSQVEEMIGISKNTVIKYKNSKWNLKTDNTLDNDTKKENVVNLDMLNDLPLIEPKKYLVENALRYHLELIKILPESYGKHRITLLKSKRNNPTNSNS